MFSVKSQRRLKETESDLFYHLSLNFEAVSGVSKVVQISSVSPSDKCESRADARHRNFGTFYNFTHGQRQPGAHEDGGVLGHGHGV